MRGRWLRLKTLDLCFRLAHFRSRCAVFVRHIDAQLARLHSYDGIWAPFSQGEAHLREMLRALAPPPQRRAVFGGFVTPIHGYVWISTTTRNDLNDRDVSEGNCRASLLPAPVVAEAGGRRPWLERRS